MSENDEEIKIVDKRRFDSAGNKRSTDEEDASEAPKQKVESSADYAGDLPPISFNGFVMSLATQALMQLGEIDPPAGVDLPKDVIAAKQTIDIISMLEEKTKGNLEDSEKQLIGEILHNLRITYVKVAKS